MGKRVVILGYSGSVHIQRWVRAMAERDYEIVLISLGGEHIEDVETIVLPVEGNRRLNYLRYLPRVRKLIRKLKPRLLHSHYATGFGLWGTYSSYHPHIISVWGADIIDFPDNAAKKYLLRKILRNSDRLTATSDFLKARTTELSPTLENEIEVIPFGVRLPDITAPADRRKAVRLAYIKAHRPKYGPDVLLKAMPAIIGEFPDIHLSLAGAGEMTGTLRNLAQKLDITEHVSFTGFIDNRKIPEFLADHDIMIMPSVMASESFGVAVLEASAVGLPVVASNIGGVPEVVKNGTTGLLVPPGDAKALAAAVINLVDNAELRKEMGQAGRDFVKEKYAWGNCVDMMDDLYQRMINRESHS